MMEKRNVATSRREASPASDDDMVDRAAAMLSGSEKMASVRDDRSSDDEKYDEDTGTGDRRKR